MKLYLAALLLFIPLLIFFEVFEPAYELLMDWYSQTVYVQEAFAPGTEPPSYTSFIGWKLTAGFHSFPLFVIAFLKSGIVSTAAILLIRLKPRLASLWKLLLLLALMLLVQYPFGFYPQFDESYRFTLLFICSLFFLCPSLLIATRLLRKPETRALSL